MKPGLVIRAERTQYRDNETGRTVTFWTGDAAHNLGLYYH